MTARTGKATLAVVGGGARPAFLIASDKVALAPAGTLSTTQFGFNGTGGLTCKAFILAAAVPGAPAASVALNAKSTSDTNVNPGTSISHHNLTIAAGQNIGLVAYLSFNTTVSNINLSWGAQALTLIGSVTDAGGAFFLMYGLLGPATGNQTLSASWTGSAVGMLAGAAFNNVTQASFAAAFANFNSAIGSGATSSVAIASAIADIVTGVFTNDTGAPNGTLVFSDGSFQDSAANFAPGAASVNETGTTFGGSWGVAGVDIVSATPTAQSGLFPLGSLTVSGLQQQIDNSETFAAAGTLADVGPDLLIAVDAALLGAIGTVVCDGTVVSGGGGTGTNRNGAATLPVVGGLGVDGIVEQIDHGPETFAAAGSLACAAVILAADAIALAGAGSLIAPAVELAVDTVSLPAASSLVAADVAIEIGAAGLGAVGSLGCNAFPAQFDNAEGFAGVGSLVCKAVIIAADAVALASAGAVAAPAVLIAVDKVQLAGAGSLTVIIGGQLGGATCNGSGSLTCGAVILAVDQVALAAVGSLGAVASIADIDSIGLGAVGSLSVSAKVIAAASAQLASIGGEISVDRAILIAAVANAAVGSFHGAAAARCAAASGLSPVGSLIAIATEVDIASASMAAIGTLGVDGIVRKIVADKKQAYTVSGRLSRPRILGIQR